MPIVTLTTDFGARDWFVGSIKGIILGVNPQITVVDNTHEIPAGDIRAGAFALAASCRCYPRLTVHMAVVDPGVGSSRAGIVVRTADHFFVGPDNGVLSLALAQEKALEIRRIDNQTFMRSPVCHTFHGRDVFAPVAARLTQGVILDAIGSKLPDYTRLEWAQPKVVGGLLRGEIIYIDRFGNCITNIDAGMKVTGKVRVAGTMECEFRRTYSDVAPGQPVALIGSTSFLEIAVNAGHAAQTLGLKLGDPIEVK
jgi:S-adenosyl-L-methionine hydrolase (adenosine-forming)